jgi:hypothetical protein
LAVAVAAFQPGGMGGGVNLFELLDADLGVNLRGGKLVKGS